MQMEPPAYVLDQQTTAILVLDAALTVRYVNQAAEALLQASAHRLCGAPLERVFYDVDDTGTALREALERQLGFTKREALLRTFNGARLCVDYTVSPIIDRAPAELLLEIRSLDRLQRINREDQLISAHETTRKLVRGLAHEIKNPLGGIRGAAQLLERELATERLRDYTQVIISEADRLRKLVDRMLTPSAPPHLTRVNVHEVLERVIYLVDAEAPGTIRMVRDYDPSLPPIEADSELLIQAMLNILRNAQQALTDTAAPEVRITTRIVRQFTIAQQRHRMVARVTVSDNGPGIPAELIERIYYPMISGRADGSGLGLSITQNIINQLNGVIECESHPGRTEFAVYLPLEQPRDAKQ
jgi:two-component system, NtrC family, nitrogen regulation sensor histidine kinase GlnL